MTINQTKQINEARKRHAREAARRRRRALSMLILLTTAGTLGMRLTRNDLTVAKADAFTQHQVIEIIEDIKSIEDVMPQSPAVGAEKGIVVNEQYQEDLDWLAQILYTEIQHEYNKNNGKWSQSSDEAVLWVAASIVNRMNSRLYPNTIKGLVMQGNGRQYNGYKSSDWGTTTPRMYQLADMALSGEFTIDSNIMWYFNPTVSTDTKFVNSMMKYKVYEVGGHVFCNNDGRL